MGSTVLGGLLGTIMGLMCGYFLGWFDLIIQRIIDMISPPLLVVALVMAASLGPSRHDHSDFDAISSTSCACNTIKCPIYERCRS